MDEGVHGAELRVFVQLPQDVLAWYGIEGVCKVYFYRYMREI